MKVSIEVRLQMAGKLLYHCGKNYFMMEEATEVDEVELPVDSKCDKQQQFISNIIDESPPKISHMRSDYLEWPDYFMAVAFLSAQRSKDPSSQVGACIVNQEKRIVGIGYNGMPTGCDDNIMPWNREGDSLLDTKHAYVCHAEMNAILNKNSADVKNCTIYVALFPCNECAKLIIQSGIKEVVYYSDKYHDRPEMKAAKRMFDITKIKYWQHQPKKATITIDFKVIEKNKPKPSGMKKLAFSP